MGQRIDRDVFNEQDYEHFGQRLASCLAALSDLLDRPGFGVGPASVGAELELFLVDGAGRPLRRNEAVRAAAADPTGHAGDRSLQPGAELLPDPSRRAPVHHSRR